MSQHVSLVIYMNENDSSKYLCVKALGSIIWNRMLSYRIVQHDNQCFRYVTRVVLWRGKFVWGEG